MLADAGLSKKFWAGVANITTYERKCSPMRTVSSTLKEAWKGKSVTLGHLRVFGYRSFLTYLERDA
jgi:hypothetical protein